MSDDQMKATFGVDETMQMLQFREMVKSQMTPEEYEQNMKAHKDAIQSVVDKSGMQPIEVGEFIVDQLDADSTIDEDQKEVWKALVVLAAFEMSEF